MEPVKLSIGGERRSYVVERELPDGRIVLRPVPDSQPEAAADAGTLDGLLAEISSVLKPPAA